MAQESERISGEVVVYGFSQDLCQAVARAETTEG